MNLHTNQNIQTQDHQPGGLRSFQSLDTGLKYCIRQSSKPSFLSTQLVSLSYRHFAMSVTISESLQFAFHLRMLPWVFRSFKFMLKREVTLNTITSAARARAQPDLLSNHYVARMLVRFGKSVNISKFQIIRVSIKYTDVNY